MSYVVGILIGLIVIGLLWGVIYLLVERQQWLDEHCTVIGKMSGSTGVGPTVNVSTGGIGVGTVYIPVKTGYKCDDGLEYWE